MVLVCLVIDFVGKRKAIVSEIVHLLMVAVEVFVIVISAWFDCGCCGGALQEARRFDVTRWRATICDALVFQLSVADETTFFQRSHSLEIRPTRSRAMNVVVLMLYVPI